ncbi:MAG: hypothetical protein WCL00_00510 [Bacteroidota bacterium]
MNRFVLPCLSFLLLSSILLFSQNNANMQDFGITAGGFTNFPCNENYMKENIGVFYVAPYIRTGKHEFTAGILMPLSAHSLVFNTQTLQPRPGFKLGYKFYVFNIYSRENLFIHYTFEYLRFKGTLDNSYLYYNLAATEKDMYINNVIGLGYNLFFDSEERFGFYYTFDYIISQAGYQSDYPGNSDHLWRTQYFWNHLSTHFGVSFKITSLKKQVKK